MLKSLRLSARVAYVSVLAWTGCLWWAKRQLRRSGAVITLAFHRVLDESSFAKTNSLQGILVKEQTFRELVAHVTRHFQPIALEDAIPGKPSQKIKVAFTFDDGWRDNYTVALPIARASGLPFTVFVCPGLSGRIEPFWPEHAYSLLRALRKEQNDSEIVAMIEGLKHLPSEERERYLASLREEAILHQVMPQPSGEDRVLSSAEIVEMAKSGVSFGSHTHTHQILTTISMESVELELAQSKLAIEKLLGRPCTTLAYPNGDWSPEIAHIAGRVGFRTAVTTQRGAWTQASDTLAIPRSYVCEAGVTGLHGGFSPAMLEYKVFWLAWRAMKRPNNSIAWMLSRRSEARS